MDGAGFSNSMTTVNGSSASGKFFSKDVAAKFGSSSGCSCSSGCSFTQTRIVGGRERCLLCAGTRALSQCLSSGFVTSLGGCSTSRVIEVCKARMLAGVAINNSCETCCGSIVMRRTGHARGVGAMATNTGCGVGGIKLSTGKD